MLPEERGHVGDNDLALTSFVAAAVAATLAISIGAGALMANPVGVETAAWSTADGLAAIGATVASDARRYL